jgi:hypothetical protein
VPLSLCFLLNSESARATISKMFEKYVERQQEGIALRKKARCHASSEKFKTNEQPTQFYLGKWGKFRLLIYNSSELA